MKRLVFLALVLLAGCNDPQPLTVQPLDWAAPGNDRFEMRLVRVYSDKLAYGGWRGIYVLVDTTTGTEYVGVSGVGISELGAHRAGKTTVGDER